MKFLSPTLLSLLFLQSYADEVATQPEPTFLKEDFDNAESLFFGKLSFPLSRHKHISFAPGKGLGGSNAIRVEYVGFEKGSERVVVRVPLGFHSEQATMSFHVYFDQDFQWVKGGKLNGLGPAKPVTGGKALHPSGWSVRTSFGEEGRGRIYLYDQRADDSDFGVKTHTPEPVFTRQTWHQVVLQVSLNTPNVPNGWSKMFVDGVEVLNRTELYFRLVGGPESEIQKFMFGTFHGGHTPEVAPKNPDGTYATVHAYFDNFVISKGIHSPADIMTVQALGSVERAPPPAPAPEPLTVSAGGFVPRPGSVPAAPAPEPDPPETESPTTFDGPIDSVSGKDSAAPSTSSR